MAPRRIVVTGSSGLVGSRLVPYLNATGYEVIRLVRRRPKRAGESFWNPETGEIDRSVLNGACAVINMAGVSIADKRWSRAQKQVILDSRIDATRLLVSTLAESATPPNLLISTSAVGYYGDSGATILTEASPIGGGFLAGVCEAWESESDRARDAGIRVVHPRFGIVLAGEGGMVPRIARFFRLGLGGRIGDGAQFMSWIDIDDLVRLLGHLVESGRPGEIVNAVAPNPVTNQDFTDALSATLHRAALLPVPKLTIRMALGEMGEELLLASQRAIPLALTQSAFTFLYPTVEESLRHVLTPGGASVTATSNLSTNTAGDSAGMSGELNMGNR